MIGTLLKRTAPTHFAQPYTLEHDGNFHLLEARRGRGKSYTMAYWALQAARQKIGTCSNFHINHWHMALRLVSEAIWPSLDDAYNWCVDNIRYIDNWDDVMTAYDCLILLDEVNRLFDAKDSKEDRVPRVVFEWLQLSRRNKITLVFAAQSMDWLNVRVRQLFDNLWRAKKELHTRGKLRGQIKQFWLYGADPWANGLNAEVIRNADYKARILFDPRIYRLYDTVERIQALDNVSQFSRFSDVYQYQQAVGIVPPPPAPVRRSPSWSEYEALWDATTAEGGGAAQCAPHAPQPEAVAEYVDAPRGADAAHAVRVKRRVHRVNHKQGVGVA